MTYQFSVSVCANSRDYENMLIYDVYDTVYRTFSYEEAVARARNHFKNEILQSDNMPVKCRENRQLLCDMLDECEVSLFDKNDVAMMCEFYIELD